MIFKNPSALKRRICQLTHREASARLKVFEDTSEFMLIDVGDVMRLANSDYLVTGHAREGRFGIDDQPKFWVKKAVDLTTGEKKIIKLVFLETFSNTVGETSFQFVRSPEKEASVLEKMQGHPNFMHGQWVRDAAGNIVRIIDFIAGPSLYAYLRQLEMPPTIYYHQEMPRVMQLFIRSVQGLSDLHRFGLHHGDIRADHLIVNNQTGNHVWIDFDYEVSRIDYDVLCLGNVLLQVVGKGRHSLHDIRLQSLDYPDLGSPLIPGDMSLMFRYRVANLGKLYP
ncbi:MAG: protein kinase, partial [Proteobacteria bacterium]|nr:protein kinase [Pseudomonadota bacterium]